ncbi:MAG: hypothetical protein RJA29_1169, partial [Pseudomonadota bacterium]
MRGFDGSGRLGVFNQQGNALSAPHAG